MSQRVAPCFPLRLPIRTSSQVFRAANIFFGDEREWLMKRAEMNVPVLPESGSDRLGGAAAPGAVEPQTTVTFLQGSRL